MFGKHTYKQIGREQERNACDVSPLSSKQSSGRRQIRFEAAPTELCDGDSRIGFESVAISPIDSTVNFLPIIIDLEIGLESRLYQACDDFGYSNLFCILPLLIASHPPWSSAKLRFLNFDFLRYGRVRMKYLCLYWDGVHLVGD